MPGACRWESAHQSCKGTLLTRVRTLVGWLVCGLLIGSGLQLSITWAQDGPVTRWSNLRGVTDGNGYLRIAFSSSGYSGQDGPLTNMANLGVRTDANGYLIVALSGNPVFEGATADDFETTLSITDPTADNTITLPNSSGTVALLDGTNADGLELVLTDAGPHAIGAAAFSTSQFSLRGTFAEQIGFRVESTLTPPAGQSSAAIYLDPTITEAGSGTHSLLAGVRIQAPAVTGGAATVTNAASLYINDAMAASGASNYAILVDAGMSRFDGPIQQTAQSVTVDAATTFDAAASYVVLACTGAETINTITMTGDQGGVILDIEHSDTDCTIADDDSPTAADAIDLTGTATNDTGAVNKIISLRRHSDGYWIQLAESDN